MPHFEERIATGAKQGEASWPMLVATFFGIGRVRPGPGTWASAGTVVLWAALAYALPASLRTPVIAALAILVTLTGIPTATSVSRSSGVKDPQFVVIDEVAGQLVALIAVSLVPSIQDRGHKTSKLASNAGSNALNSLGVNPVKATHLRRLRLSLV